MNPHHVLSDEEIIELLRDDPDDLVQELLLRFILLTEDRKCRLEEALQAPRSPQ